MSWTSVDVIRDYLTKLKEVGIDVPVEVMAAIERLHDRQLETHGK